MEMVRGCQADRRNGLVPVPSLRCQPQWPATSSDARWYRARDRARRRLRDPAWARCLGCRRRALGLHRFRGHARVRTRRACRRTADAVLGAYDRHDGRLVKTTGDGVIGLFDSAERAIRAGAALADVLRPLGIRVRAGVHSGEVEIAPGDVRGVAVHAAARIMALAAPDDVWVSATV